MKFDAEMMELNSQEFDVKKVWSVTCDKCFENSSNMLCMLGIL